MKKTVAVKKTKKNDPSIFRFQRIAGKFRRLFDFCREVKYYFQRIDRFSHLGFGN